MTISVPDPIASAAKVVAEQQGTSVSALAAKGLQAQVVAAAARAYRKFVDDNTDIAEQLAAWRRVAEENRKARWARLADKA